MTDADLDEKTCQRCGQTFRRTKRRTRKEFETRKYCGEGCAQKAIPRRGRPRRERCLKDLHDLDEANTRIDYRGNRSCKACAAQGQRTRDEGRPRRRKHKAAPLIPSVADVIPHVVPALERPAWRPAGFTPQPRIPQRQEKAS